MTLSLKPAVLLLLAAAISLQAQSQAVADGSGVTVNLNGSQLLHRSPVLYPVDALMKGVQGTVVIQARLDANGEVIDAAILSGPDELRKTVQESVLNWHFDKSAGGSTRVVNIDFVKTANTIVPTVVSSSDSFPFRTATQVQVTNTTLAPSPRSGTIDQLDVTGLSDSARVDLLAKFPVHAGDPFTRDSITLASEAARAFDSHLAVTITSGPSGLNVMTIRPQQPSAFVASRLSVAPRPDAVPVAGNVATANLISATKPVYPPLAKMARQQGTVKFDATIGKDGTMEDLKVISGPPLLVPAALQAVKTWTYKPTLLNGVPVAVATTIDVNFTLTEDAAPPAAQ